jgi:hypothetical protein
VDGAEVRGPSRAERQAQSCWAGDGEIRNVQGAGCSVQGAGARCRVHGARCEVPVQGASGRCTPHPGAPCTSTLLPARCTLHGARHAERCTLHLELYAL